MDDDRCAACGTERGFRFVCSECGFSFCKEHANPSLHRCPELESGEEASTAAEALERDADEPGSQAGAETPGRLHGVRTTVATASDDVRQAARAGFARARSLPSRGTRGVGDAVRCLQAGAMHCLSKTGQPLWTAAGKCRSIASTVREIPRRGAGAVRKPLSWYGDRAGRSDADSSRSAENGLIDWSRFRPGIPDAVGTVRRRVSAAAGTLWDGTRAASGALASVYQRPSRQLTIAAAIAGLLVFTMGAAGGVTETMTTIDPLDGSDQKPDVARETDDRATAQLQQVIFEEVNDARQNASREPVRFDPNLSVIAAYHSHDMAREGYAGLESPAGHNVTDRFRRFGYSCERAGQMVLWVDDAEQTRTRSLAEAIVDQWLASEEHAAFLRDSGYDRAGVGVSVAEGGRLYVSLATCDV